MGATATDQGIQLSENAITVLERRYLRKGPDGRPLERPEDMFRRVARNIASAETKYGTDGDARKWESAFYDMMVNLEFMPNSPTLMNAGREFQQLSACFVLPVEDSMDSIFEAVKNTALIHKSGGGTGFSFSRLRPANDIVSSTQGVSSGPVSFMAVFDAATDAIKQGGTRRGANMAVLRVDHPDIQQFIRCKTEHDRLNNFNISVALTEQFMRAVDLDEEYDLVNPRTNEATKRLKAKEVWDTIVQHAWDNGDPGIIFLDRVNRDNPTPQVGEIESTNPCGEQPLLPYESCNLGSISLSKMVREVAGKYEVDWERLARTTASAVRFLDNVIDMNRHPLDKIAELTKANRKIGLGVMGFADMLILLEIAYDSVQAVELGRDLMRFIRDHARKASQQLAAERGTFPNFRGSIFDQPEGMELRNATLTTIAPTGTISIIAGCSSGIEPLFAVCFVRHVMDDDELVEAHPLFEEMARDRGFYSPELMREIAKRGHLHEVEAVPEEVKRLFRTAHDIDPEWHIRIQAAFQEHTDNAVSKTVNFRHEATVEEVDRVYRLAYDLGCKGVTIYRDGSRDVQVLTAGDRRPEEQPVVTKPGTIKPRPRPTRMLGQTIVMTTGCGKLYVTINEDEHGPFEVFAQMGKAGGCAASQSEALARMISLAFRSGVEPKEVIRQLKGISCHLPAWEQGGSKIVSCADAIGRAIERVILADTDQLPLNFEGANGDKVGACPDCGGTVEHADGCLVCRNCGYTRC